MMNALEEALQEATKNNRVCPKPNKWNDLYNLLPRRQLKTGGWEPSLPLILAAWHDTPNLSKSLRLQEHLEWANLHQIIDKVLAFMQKLDEHDWHHYFD